MKKVKHAKKGGKKLKVVKVKKHKVPAHKKNIIGGSHGI
jgi:hypothetical protein